MQNSKTLNIRLQNSNNEIKSIDKQIASLRQRRQALSQEKKLLEEQLRSSSSLQNDDKFMTQSFPWSEEAQRLLETVFKLTQFRSYQLATINATLSGFDILLIMPTGGGKSLCFQLTALVNQGMLC